MAEFTGATGTIHYGHWEPVTPSSVVVSRTATRSTACWWSSSEPDVTVAAYSLGQRC
ncbi:hypothetical protein [Kutzneria kofuensis]|uniref:Uncharacterized protein n=1 Tax=Kutzneria kofuensis TaxID=103725 RepID=A0A7W9KR69_9PSEU|nr:hypothetical protein [Kutzneria kofuensis]